MDPYDYSASNRERAKKEWKERKREAGRRDWKALYQSDPTPPEQCPSEGQFGPCTQQCEHPAGHDGQHRAQCFTWDETSWTQTDDTGETVAAVSYAEKIDLSTQPYTGQITDNQYVELFLRGEFYVVREDQP